MRKTHWSHINNILIFVDYQNQIKGTIKYISKIRNERKRGKSKHHSKALIKNPRHYSMALNVPILVLVTFSIFVHLSTYCF